MNNVAIIDYCSGNIASLFAAFKSLGSNPYLESSVNDFKEANSIVLPGVCHFGYACENLDNKGLREPLIEIIKSGIPTLGICLGFQLLCINSEECLKYPGLEILPLKTIKLNPKNSLKYKVPHIGWNSINVLENQSSLLKSISAEERIFYYSNSFGILPSKKFKSIYATYFHEKNYLALLEYQNIYGVQFHPEKSMKQGLKLIQNFLLKNN